MNPKPACHVKVSFQMHFLVQCSGLPSHVAKLGVAGIFALKLQADALLPGSNPLKHSSAAFPVDWCGVCVCSPRPSGVFLFPVNRG